MDIFIRMFDEGGVVMVPILLVGVFGITVALERVIYVYMRAAINGRLFLTEIQRLVLGGDLDAALRLCNAEPSAALPRVVKAALLHANRPDEEVRDALEEEVLAVTPLVNKRLSYLPLMANIATLLGLLGTIQGLIECFHAVGEASPEARATALSSGIAVAMYTTFFGLLVAIVLLLVHGLVAARAVSLLDELDHASSRMANLLAALRRGAPGGGVLPFRTG